MVGRKTIKILIVDDSAVVRHYLAHEFSADPELVVIGEVSGGAEAMAFLAHQKPDVITMDLVMPGMDGIATTRQIMESYPTPIVIVTSNWTPGEVEKTFVAMEVGAMAIVEKPAGKSHPNSARMRREMVTTVKAMASVPVVRRWKNASPDAVCSFSLGRPIVPQRAGDTPWSTSQIPLRSTPLGGENSPNCPGVMRSALSKHVLSDASTVDRDSWGDVCGRQISPAMASPKLSIIAIGASTGGPLAIQTLLNGLPSEFSVPIVIVQHIAAGFTQGMADWLDKTTPLTVTVALHGERPQPKRVYIAPDGAHLEIGRVGEMMLFEEPPDRGLCPSVARLFRSVASSVGSQAVGVLLTGMGEDGAAELKQMRDAGAITFAQDAETSIVHGMPGEAIKRGAATYVMSPAGIADQLVRLVVQVQNIERE